MVGAAVVPAFPYNVSMLPPSHNGPTPDDSGINTHLPSICVDYLSHDWEEEDVWVSWKAMTKHKSEVANGVRLENASWRTWAKQRGKLKTISPETLNWLKDSDVTWLYGPLHTAVEAVPPPKVASASERLGLEPLRSFSESKSKPTAPSALGSPAVSSTSPVPATAAPGVKVRRSASLNRRLQKATKPILKYRSLSDILMPVGSPSSPILESTINFPISEDGESPVTYSKSDSNLKRMGSASRKSRYSPVHSPRASSPDTHGSDTSSAGAGDRKERRHISFNHRVEQCIAIDSTENTNRSAMHSSYNNLTVGSDDEDGDDEDDVLTFRSSPRVPTFGPSVGIHPKVRSGAGNRRPAAEEDDEPHTIEWLGPTTLKSTEEYPSPSPVVVYHQSPVEDSNAARTTNTYPVATYSSRPGSSTDGGDQNGRGSLNGRRAPMFDYSNAGVGGGVGAVHSTWDAEDDDDYAMGFDYFSGPDVGVGDEYDMVNYGSQHLIGNEHNHYGAGINAGVSGYSYGGLNSGAPSGSVTTTQNPHNTNSSSSADSSPSGSRRSTPPSVSVSPSGDNSAALLMRGPHSPGNQASSPKRSILKGARSRENSSDDGHNPMLAAVSSRLGGGSPTFASPPNSSGRASPVPSSSPSSGGFARPAVKRNTSEEGFRERESRGRSASRGSSSSLERSASSDRRSSISPTVSYASMAAAAAAGGARVVGSASGVSRSRAGSSDSLNGAGASGGGGGLGARLMPDLPEASSESETETIKATVDDTEEEGGWPASRKAVSATTVSEPSTKSHATHSDANGRAEMDVVEHVEMPDMNGAHSIPSKRSSYSPSPPTGQSPSTSPSRPSAPNAPIKPSPLGREVKKSPPASPPTATKAPAALAASSDAPAPSAIAATAPTLVNESSATSSSPHNLPSTSSSAPRFRQPSPSAATTSVAEPTPATTVDLTRSLSNSPALNPSDSTAPAWDSDETPTPSYARRSLLRAARGSSHGSINSNSTMNGLGERDEHANRGSSDSGRGSTHEDYGFDGDEQDPGIVGTARDLLGAITKGIWNMGRR